MDGLLEEPSAGKSSFDIMKSLGLEDGLPDGGEEPEPEDVGIPMSGFERSWPVNWALGLFPAITAAGGGKKKKFFLNIFLSLPPHLHTHTHTLLLSLSQLGGKNQHLFSIAKISFG